MASKCDCINVIIIIDFCRCTHYTLHTTHLAIDRLISAHVASKTNTLIDIFYPFTLSSEAKVL